MPDFAPNYTARYRLRYSVLGHEHTMLFRIARGVGSTGLALMVAKAGDFLTAIEDARYTDWLELSAEYAAEDTDIFAPAALPTVSTGTAAIPAQSVSQSTYAVSFVGRSAAGQKAKFFVYGVSFDPENLVTPGDNFRITSAENAIVAAGVAELNSGAPDIVASDNFGVSWYPYVNGKYNDHWVAAVR